MLFIDSILQDNILAKKEEKKFFELQAEKLPEKYNINYSIFNKDNSIVLLADGNTFNGKIVYFTPNFPYLFMFNEKEILNITIEDLVPNVINFHKYLVEDIIKNSNLNYAFKGLRNAFLKGKNGLIFNVYLYVKPVPNLYYGLVYFIYIQKINIENFIILIDKNFLINGSSETSMTDNNFIIGNNYNLSLYINGHHIGAIIPEIFLYLNYDIKTDSFYLYKKNIDLKGYLYPIIDFKNIDENISIILNEIKKRKNTERQNKIEIYEEYDELISSLNKENIKPFSIFFRIESYSFLKGKYMYYRVYISNDIMNENNYLINNHLNSENISNEN